MTACATLPAEAEPGATTGASATPVTNLCYEDGRAHTKGPYFCHGPGGTYIAGLPPNHGWKPGMRVLFKQDSDAIMISRDLGAAWVVKAHEQAVEIHVLMQARGSSLLGATAYLAGSAQDILAGSFLARVTKRDGAQLTLDVGSADGVKAGDVYEARDPKQRDLPVGRAVVRSVHAGHSIARVIDGAGDQDEWVLAGSEAEPRPRALKVLVVPSRAAGPQLNFTRVRTALAAAKKLSAAAPVQVVEAKPVAAAAGDKLHELLLQRARHHDADLVVWMPEDCPAGGCPHVLHSVVPAADDGKLRPEPLVLPSKPAMNATDDARAVLGQLAHAAGLLDEASYQLRAWAGGTAPPEVLTRLAEAELALGQRERARLWLAAAASRKDVRTYLALANVACKEGEPQELAALEGLLEKQSTASPGLRTAHLAALICSVEAGMQHKVEARRTDRLIKKGLALGEELADRAAQTTLKRDLGRSLAAQGKFAKADQMFAAAIKLAAAANDRAMQARIGLDRAIVRERSGNPLQAERHARAAFKLFKANHDEQGIVDCVPVVVRLERHLHGLQAARTFLETERAELRGQRLDRALFALGQESAYLAIERGDLNRALTDLGTLSAVARKHKLVDEEIGLQGMFAEYYLLSGQTRKARDLLDADARRIDAGRPGPTEARVLLLYARFRLQEGDPDAARGLSARALRTYASLGDDGGAAAAFLVRAEVEREFGDKDTAESFYKESRRLFTKVQDTEGVYKVALGEAALTLWRGRMAGAERLFPPIIRYFQGSGNGMLALEASLLFAWADFERTHDSEKTLQSLRSIKEKAVKQRYARLEAETQMLIACVHRRDSDHVVAEQDLAAGQKLYAAIGRHAQRWPCEVVDGGEAVEVEPAPPVSQAAPAARRAAVARAPRQARPKPP